MMEFLQRTGLIVPLVSVAVLVGIIMFLSYLDLIKETHETLERVKRLEERMSELMRLDNK